MVDSSVKNWESSNKMKRQIIILLIAFLLVGCYDFMYFSWAPDGTKITYSPPSRPQNIWLLDINTGEKKQLTNGIKDEFAPQFSPTGDLIAYISETEAGSYSLCIMKAYGSKNKEIATILGANVDVPPFSFYEGMISSGAFSGPGYNKSERVRMSLTFDWAPDGKKIVFTTPEGICLINADGSDKKIVSKGWSPRFSPDGKKIVFSSWKGELKIFNLSDGSIKTVDTLSAYNDYFLPAQWSQDSKKIAVYYLSSMGYEMYIKDTAKANSDKITNSEEGDSGQNYEKEVNIPLVEAFLTREEELAGGELPNHIILSSDWQKGILIGPIKDSQDKQSFQKIEEAGVLYIIDPQSTKIVLKVNEIFSDLINKPNLSQDENESSAEELLSRYVEATTFNKFALWSPKDNFIAFRVIVPDPESEEIIEKDDLWIIDAEDFSKKKFDLLESK